VVVVVAAVAVAALILVMYVKRRRKPDTAQGLMETVQVSRAERLTKLLYSWKYKSISCIATGGSAVIYSQLQSSTSIWDYVCVVLGTASWFAAAPIVASTRKQLLALREEAGSAARSAVGPTSSFDACLTHIDENGTEGQKMHAAYVRAAHIRSADGGSSSLAEIRVVAMEVRTTHTYSGVLGLCGFFVGILDLIQDGLLLQEVWSKPVLLYCVASSILVTTVVSLLIGFGIIAEIRARDREADEWLLERSKRLLLPVLYSAHSCELYR